MTGYIQLKEQEWNLVAKKYLPNLQGNSVWRQSGSTPASLPIQGWKIHISATILSAIEVLEIVGPILNSKGIYFKGITTLSELQKLNCGLYYGFSQVGKFLTIYFQNESLFIETAVELHTVTKHLSGPPVPYDVSFPDSSIIFYRYGAFRGQEITTEEGVTIPDERRPNAAIPPSISDPFSETRKSITTSSKGLLKTTFRAYEALSQRGKGGVYRALDLSVVPSRICIIKEGRTFGETEWDGRNGWWRVSHERLVLDDLYKKKVNSPQVIEFFEVSNNAYLILENIKGLNLQEILLKVQGKKLSIGVCLYLSESIASLLARIHKAGWAWRDCKPLNLILCPDGTVRPLDFEGASQIINPDPVPWGTKGYTPPEWGDVHSEILHIKQDLYALGVTMLQLLNGNTIPSKEQRFPIKISRKIPNDVHHIIMSLTSQTPSKRLSANMVTKKLKNLQSSDSKRRARKVIEKMAISLTSKHT